MTQCECCGIENGWGLMNPDFEFVCQPCAEGGKQQVMFIDGRYRKYHDLKINWVYGVKDPEPLLGASSPLKIK